MSNSNFHYLKTCIFNFILKILFHLIGYFKT